MLTELSAGHCRMLNWPLADLRGGAIFMQFSAKKLQSNPNLGVAAPPRENPVCATVDCVQCAMDTIDLTFDGVRISISSNYLYLYLGLMVPCESGKNRSVAGRFLVMNRKASTKQSNSGFRCNLWVKTRESLPWQPTCEWKQGNHCHGNQPVSENKGITRGGSPVEDCANPPGGANISQNCMKLRKNFGHGEAPPPWIRHWSLPWQQACE